MTDGTEGCIMNVDTEGNNYVLCVNQVEDGPTLDVRGFPTPQFYLHRGGESIELVLDLSNYTFKASGVAMQANQDFWITQGIDGPVYASATGSYEIINADHSYAQVIKNGINFKMGVTGTFNFEFFIADDGSGNASIDVAPTSGVWPGPTPNYSLCYELDGDDVEIPFINNGDGTYTLTETNLYRDQPFWIIRELDGEKKNYGDSKDNLIIHPYNSSDIQLSPNGWDYLMGGSGTFTFTITETTNGPKLSITGWPESQFNLMYGPVEVDGVRQNLLKPFTKNTSDATWTTTMTVTEEMAANNLFTISILDGDFPYGFGVPETHTTLNRDNSQNIPLDCNNAFDIKLPAGEYTFTINPDFTLSIEWPDLIYSLYGIADSQFTKNADGSYTKTLEITTAMLQNNDTKAFDIVCENLEDHWVYYGIPITFDNLNRENSQNIPLGRGEGYKNISLNRAGTYTLTINPDFTLSIEWPHGNYVLNYRSSTNENRYSVPFEYYAGTHTANVALKKGDEFWVSDGNTWMGYGLDTQESQPTVDAINASGLKLIPSGKIAAIQATNNFTFTMQEDETSDNLIMDITGWLVNNSNLEGSNMSCFFMAETPGSTYVPARVVDGAGVDGTRGIVINSIDNATNDWDSQFFIRLSETLPKGTKYRISFDYKASQNATVTTQVHGEPGGYIYWKAFGNVNFTNKWQHFEIEETITTDQSPSDNMRTFAFMLCGNKSATTFYLDNIVVEADLPEPEMNVVKNGNIEGADMSCFFKKVSGEQTVPVQAPYTTGVGVNGSRGIVVNSIDNPQYEWDAQFFIRLPQTLPEGTKYFISFDYKASKDARAITQVHGEPGEYIHYYGIGDVNFTTDWQHFAKIGTITHQQAQNSDGDLLMRTFAFNLAENQEATSFYFDNIKVEIDKVHYVYQRGDANGDGEVTIADVVTIVDYTLGKASPTFVESAADLNYDGQINVSDVVALVNILLGKDSQ